MAEEGRKIFLLPPKTHALPEIRRKSRLDPELPIPKPRDHIRREVCSLVKEYVPSFDFIATTSNEEAFHQFSSKTKAKRPQGWAAEYAKKKKAFALAQAEKESLEHDPPQPELMNTTTSENRHTEEKRPAMNEHIDHQIDRNRFCDYCLSFVAPGSNRVECIHCNVVAHLHCALPQSSNSACTPQAWVCNDCTQAIENTRRQEIIDAADRALEIARYEHAIAIQARVRVFLDRSPFLKLRKGIVAIQGALRSFSARQQFKEKYANVERPYIIKVHSATPIPDNTEFFCIVSIVQIDDQPLPDIRETGKTLYQFYTKCSRRDPMTKTIFFESGAQFLIPSSVCGVICYISLVSKIPKKTIDSESLTSSLVYHGQARWNIETPLLYYHQISKCLQTTISTTQGGFDHTTTYLQPREKPGSANLIPMYTHTSASSESAARPMIKVELIPCQKAYTRCGHLDEVSSIFSRKSVKRRWWCLLVESTLYFYRGHHEPAPAMVFHLSKSNMKMYPEAGVLAIKSTDKTVHISSSSAASRTEWFRMLKRSFDALKVRNLNTPIIHNKPPEDDPSLSTANSCARSITRLRRASFSYEDLAAAPKAPF